ncbi:hypothetical protein GDO86_016552 [Hymenochirus boettgeri]|uniref:Ig-like domain-containing protein n=1 Tax=Hymenochirus boettgeri TaxID=247094 RepID=A0A8T2K0Q9_9PIPI|nr:hypothetical protein GDO86_016552 [Hymenochirus boettgeri]
MGTENMEICWYRSSLIPYVHLYEKQQDNYTQQMEEFINRTELIKDDIARGNISLIIRNVTASDLGEYNCFFETDQHHGRAKVDLSVLLMGTEPTIWTKCTGTMNMAVCESHGWNPKPTLTWTDDLGNVIDPSMAKELRDEDNLFTIISIIYFPIYGNVTCSVRNEMLNQGKQSSSLSKGNDSLEHETRHRHLVFILLGGFILICISLRGCIHWMNYRNLQTEIVSD